MYYALLVVFLFSGALGCAGLVTPDMYPVVEDDRYATCVAEEKLKAAAAQEIAPTYEQKAKQLASPNLERCEIFRVDRNMGTYGDFEGFGSQPGRGYYSTEDCSNWRQYGLEEACRRQQARDGSNQRQGAFDLGRSGANCGGFGVADLRESCEFGRRVTREREAERVFNLTR